MEKVEFTHRHIEDLWKIVCELPMPNSQWIVAHKEDDYDSSPFWSAPAPEKKGMSDEEYKARSILLFWLLTYAAHKEHNETNTDGKMPKGPSRKVSQQNVEEFGLLLTKFLDRLKDSTEVQRLWKKLRELPIEHQAFIEGNVASYHEPYPQVEYSRNIGINPITDYLDTMCRRTHWLAHDLTLEEADSKHNSATLHMCRGAASTLEQAGIALTKGRTGALARVIGGLFDLLNLTKDSAEHWADRTINNIQAAKGK